MWLLLKCLRPGTVLGHWPTDTELAVSVLPGWEAQKHKDAS